MPAAKNQTLSSYQLRLAVLERVEQSPWAKISAKSPRSAQQASSGSHTALVATPRQNAQTSTIRVRMLNVRPLVRMARGLPPEAPAGSVEPPFQHQSTVTKERSLALSRLLNSCAALLFSLVAVGEAGCIEDWTIVRQDR